MFRAWPTTSLGSFEFQSIPKHSFSILTVSWATTIDVTPNSNKSQCAIHSREKNMEFETNRAALEFIREHFASLEDLSQSQLLGSPRGPPFL
ncbi:hypothetical protein PM082_017494 [Marasmius tenuissimus]|nr:hypothetical protein PM082_017494 [Marasmius tenuissimus]